MDTVGDILIFSIEEHFQQIECKVIELDDNGRASKLQAIVPDPYLAKIGFFKEGDNYVIFNLDILTSN